MKDNLVEISSRSKETNREGFSCGLYSEHPLMPGDISRSRYSGAFSFFSCRFYSSDKTGSNWSKV